MASRELSYLSIKPHLTRLRWTGFYPLKSDTPKLYKFLQKVWMCFAVFFVPLFVVQQSIKVYKERDDLYKVVGITLLLLTNTDCIYKQLTMRMKSNSIEELVVIMKGSRFNPGLKEYKELLFANMRFSHLFLRAFNCTGLLTCVLWVVYPMVLLLQDCLDDFELAFPFQVEERRNAYGALLYVWIQTSWTAFHSTTIDAFVSFCLAQSKTQLSIVRLDLEKLVEKSKEEAKLFSIPLTNVLRKRFQEVLLHYNEIVYFTEKLIKIFSGVLFYQFTVSGWKICMTAYRTLKIDLLSIECAAFVMYMICMLSELFLFCHFGHLVFWECALVLDSAYAMDWLEFDVKLRKDLIIFMERVKRPLLPRAGSFIPLSNSTFVSILRNAYSFYALLKNTS